MMTSLSLAYLPSPITYAMDDGPVVYPHVVAVTYQIDQALSIGDCAISHSLRMSLIDKQCTIGLKTMQRLFKSWVWRLQLSIGPSCSSKLLTRRICFSCAEFPEISERIKSFANFNR